MLLLCTEAALLIPTCERALRQVESNSKRTDACILIRARLATLSTPVRPALLGPPPDLVVRGPRAAPAPAPPPATFCALSHPALRPRAPPRAAALAGQAAAARAALASTCLPPPGPRLALEPRAGAIRARPPAPASPRCWAPLRTAPGAQRRGKPTQDLSCQRRTARKGRMLRGIARPCCAAPPPPREIQSPTAPPHALT